MLGIPTVLDRMIQQALLQVLTPLFEPTFSKWSFGFRPGRSALGAVSWSRLHMTAGYRWVVDLDLEKFFDRVNHDILMSRVARRVKDPQVLRLIRRYLQAGMMEGGVVSPRREGTPQGGPLSPLLSNVLLDELDKELERRGHRFCRYADDCNVYVQSRRAGERVMESLEKFLWERLRLKVNRDKSAVARPWRRKFLGYSVTVHRTPRLKVAPESVKRLKEKLKLVLRRGRGRRLDRVIEELTPVIRGWVAYFRDVGCASKLEGAGRVAPSAPALSALAPVEAPSDPASATHCLRPGRGCRECLRLQRPWPLVERRCLAHEPRHSYPLLACSWSLELPR